MQELKKDLFKRIGAGPFFFVSLTETADHPEPLTGVIHEDFIDQIYFFVAKNNRCARAGPATATFTSRSHDYFASFKGAIVIDNNPDKIHKLWNKTLEAFFPNGERDPDLTLLRFDIDEAELWEADVSMKTKVKIAFGMGQVKKSELGTHAVVTTTNVHNNPV